MIIVTGSAKWWTDLSAQAYARVFAGEEFGARFIAGLSIAHFRAFLGALTVFALVSTRFLTWLTWHRA